jgi:hypothetical protein
VTPHLTLGAYSIVTSPLLPWSLILGLGAVLLVLASYGVFRRAHGAVMRLVLGFLAVALLVNPAVVEEQRQYEKDIALVLVDRSPSQSLEHRQQDADQAVAALRKKIAEMPDIDLHVVDSTGGSDPADKGTELVEALHGALADLPPKRLAGTIIVSDGQIHDVPADGRDPSITAPLHLLMTGDPDAIDRRLLLTETPTFGIVGKNVAVKLRVDDLGSKPDGTSTARLHVRRDGVALPDMDLVIGAETTLQLPLSHGGPSVFEFNVADGPHELTRINNSAVITVNGIRDSLKVLLVSGEPSPGERTWRNLLKSDPAVNLIHFTILRPPAKSDATPINELALIAFPIEDLFRLKLKDFDLIIFDRFQHLNILPDEYFHNIVNYVQNGGAVLEVAGPGSAGQFSLYQTPVAEIFGALPTGQEMLTGGFKPELTDLGRRHPVTAGLLDGDPAAGKAGAEPSWGRWFRQLPVNANRGTTVMTGLNNLPLLILEHQGKGRVAQLLSDQIWLWSHGFEGGGPHAELIRRIVHWLMAEPELEEEDLRASIVDGKLEVIRQSLGTDLPLLTVTHPDGQQEQVKLTAGSEGHAVATLPATEAGLYRVTDGQRQAFAAAGSLNALEFRDPRASSQPLAKLIKATGGGIVSLTKQGMPDLRRVAAGDETAGAGWFGLRENRDYVVTGIRQTPLLPVWIALILALCTMLFTWHREGR